MTGIVTGSQHSPLFVLRPFPICREMFSLPTMKIRSVIFSKCQGERGDNPDQGNLFLSFLATWQASRAGSISGDTLGSVSGAR